MASHAGPAADPGRQPEHQSATPVERTVDGSSASNASANGPAPRRARRVRSARRVPAALVALVVLAAAGVTLYDVAAVRAGGRAALWRRVLADELASRRVDDVWMLTGAAVASALGLVLIVLAVTPGLRRSLTVRAPGGRSPRHLRVTLERAGAAALLRDAAMQVPGVSAARVRVRRRRIKARADVGFRDPGQVRDDLRVALREERDQLDLAPTPRIAVRVRQRTR
ncbi:DUF6286 domain-containing protein [Streptomyces sp. MC1]|uniref:DUF6286 domain-containing protein n=1 Tax=Streptomyces sp. MC1 TaxID=295105 RepID=UPI001E62E3A0|nr:DUF6286 domain-containing protein [Streptomyces sp. MC1]